MAQHRKPAMSYMYVHTWSLSICGLLRCSGVLRLVPVIVYNELLLFSQGFDVIQAAIIGGNPYPETVCL